MIVASILIALIWCANVMPIWVNTLCTILLALVIIAEILDSKN